MRIPRPAVRSRIDLPQEHNCMFICNVIIALTEGRAREQGTICLHLRSEEQEQGYQALRLDKKGDAAEMKTFR